jgi:1-acyl-sn-glycerol-3-phosphate acyltransferase
MERVPERGPVLVVPNHDSQWDPVLVGVVLRRRRHLRFLARANLWKIPGLGPILYGLRQIPIERGAHDLGALSHAIEALRSGEAVCVFPEGRLSRGQVLAAHSGVGRLAQAVPEAKVVLCAITGTTDYVRLPLRPRVTVTLFEPAGDGRGPDEDAHGLGSRRLAEIRALAPPPPAGRSARP